MLETNPSLEDAVKRLHDQLMEVSEALRAVAALAANDEAIDPPVGAIRWAAEKGDVALGEAVDTVEAIGNRLRATLKPAA